MTEVEFLKQWKNDVMESFCKYDANSVEEVYQLGIKRGIAEYKSRLKTDVRARAQNVYLSDKQKEIFNYATRTFLEALDYFETQLKKEV